MLVMLGCLSPARSVVAQEIPTFTVEVGVRGFADPDASLMVTVTVTSPAALNGRIVVTSATGAMSSRPIELAGGTTKAVRLATDSTSVAGLLHVSLFDGDRLISEQAVDTRTVQDVEVVAVSPALTERAGGLPESVELPSSLGRAVLTTWDPELFDLGLGVVDQFDSIATTTAELTGLSPTQRATLLVWLNDGGVLVLDDTADLSALPAEWRPGPAGYTLAGRGLVRVERGAAAARRWSHVVVPTSARARETMLYNDFAGNLDSGLMREAGIRLPALRSVVLPLVAYALAAAVGVYLLVRSLRRMTLAWVLIPGLAVVASLLLVLFGGGWQTSGHPAAFTFLDCSAAGCSANTSILNFSRSGGTVTTQLPSGWSLNGSSSLLIGRRLESTILTRAADGTASLSSRLDPGQVVVNTVLGAAQLPGLTVDATSDGAKIVGTVTNHTATVVRDLVVVSAGSTVRLDPLQPGASTSYSLTVVADPRPLTAWDIWPSPSGNLPPIGAVWTNAAMTSTITASGLVRVAGWVDDLPGVAAPGAASAGVVTSTANITTTGGLVPTAVRSTIVRSPQGPGANGLEDCVIRLMIPADQTVPAQLTLTMDPGVRTVDILTASGWETLRSPTSTFTVPGSSVIDGVMLVRILNRDVAVLGDLSSVVQPKLSGGAAGG